MTRQKGKKLGALAVLGALMLMIFSLLVACGSGDVNTPGDTSPLDTSNVTAPGGITQLNVDASKLIGEWEWVISSGGFSGHQTSTPESTGHSYSIVFDKYGKFVEYTDGQAGSSGSYKLKMDKTIFSADPEPVIGMFYGDNYYPWEYVYSFEGNYTSLHLSDNASDAFSHEYRRVSDSTSTPPNTATLSGQPTDTVNYRTADIIVAGTNVVSYQYKLDSGDWGTETSASTHISLSNLTDGQHIIYVRGKDAAGNWQTEASCTTARWTVDTHLVAVIFPDPNLEAVIRGAIWKSQGTIYQSDLESITKLNPHSWNIANLSGIEHCTSLTELEFFRNPISDLSPLSYLNSLTWLKLIENEISDLSPLSGLTNLTSLYVSNNEICDLAPLSGLTNLTTLYLQENQISNLSPLSGLTSLTTLSLKENQISDLSPLSGLTSLANLNLLDNEISDISPISGLTNLTDLDLRENRISDISPILNLTNLTKLYLMNNPLNTESINIYIPQLQARGVDIYY